MRNLDLGTRRQFYYYNAVSLVEKRMRVQKSGWLLEDQS